MPFHSHAVSRHGRHANATDPSLPNMKMRKSLLGATLVVLLALTACGGSGGSAPAASSPASTASASKLSLVAQVGEKAFDDLTLSGGKNMACSSCHSPQYAYGPPNSLSVQLGSDPSQAGTRAVPSIRYKDATPPYADNAANPDGVTGAAAGGGFMWDGRAATLADQAGMPLLNPLEMNAPSKAYVVAAVQAGGYAALFRQAFGAAAFADTDTAFANLGKAVQAYETEDVSFHPYTSKFDLYVHNKIGGKLTAAEERGLRIYNGKDISNCLACHYAGVNFDGNQGLMTDFTYQAIGAPRNDSSIPGNPDPIPANDADPAYFDLGLCGPLRTDHSPAVIGTPDPYCGKFKVPTLRNAATRSVFFHNGVFHSLNQVVHFYNTRDTNPEYWYPATGGTGTPSATPSWALQLAFTPGATVHKFNDLPLAHQGNVDEEVPLGTGITPPDNSGATTLGDGVQPRALGSTPAMTDAQIADLVCFLSTLSDGYQPPATAPTTGACVN
jgi:cytochrome c peroxidase